MHAVSIPAHFDEERIQLDEPIDLAPNAKLIVTVLSEQDAEREDWIRLSLSALSAAYGDDEPEYTLDDVKVMNPHYKEKQCHQRH